MPTSKIVIKIKDEFFLQKETVVANPGKIVIDDKFFHDFNFGRVNELYPILKNAGNISESKFVFSNLIAQIATRDVNGKIESLFSVEDNTNVVNLMQMANDRSKDIGENLLNYYFIEVDSANEVRRLQELNELKISFPNLGIDYFYLRGTLANFEQQSAPQSIGDILQPDRVRVGVEKRSLKFMANTLQPEVLTMNKIAPSTAPISQSDPVSRVGTFDPPVSIPIPPLANVQPIHTIFQKFFISFGTNLASTNPLKPTIKVVDMEQGWVFDSPIKYVGSGFLPPNIKPILGGGVNKSNTNQHGQKTLNVLLGKDNSISNVDNMATLNGLCIGADVQVGSTHYTTGEFREAALASVLGYGYNEIKEAISGSTTKRLNLYDIVLLELQISKTYKIYPNLTSSSQNSPSGSVASSYFPVEIEPAMWNVINKGIGAKYIIIEAAGNGNINLNNVYEGPFFPLKDLSNVSKGTGAIMVGAVDINDLPKLNNGDRINYRCFGDDVITSAMINVTNDKPFNSTSLASAITAALVANFQSMAENTATGIGRRLTIIEIIKVLNYVPTPPPPLPTTFKAILYKLSIY
jgi:hypothetical protein